MRKNTMELSFNETCGITFEFNEWIDKIQNYTDDFVNELKPYATGFLLQPVGMYEGEIITAKSIKSEDNNFYELVEYIKEMHGNNTGIFLYQAIQNKEDYVLRYGVLPNK